MIPIEIKGHIKNKQVVARYIGNMIFYLKLNRLRKPKLTIHFKETPEPEDHYDPVIGFSHGDHRHVEVEIFKYDHEGQLRSFKSLMTTLAHEMVHVKQFFRKELVTKNRCFYWKGTKVDESLPDWEDTAEFEIEAYDMMHDIYELCYPDFKQEDI